MDSIFALLNKAKHTKTEALPSSGNRPENNKAPTQWPTLPAARKNYFRQKLKQGEVRKLLKRIPDLHEQAFEKINCLDCAACCKNYSPRFKTPDIKRISRHLNLKEGQFIETYLRIDEEGDYVVKQSPCPFLGADNFCSIYEARPGDCHRFPYTDEDVLLKRQALTLMNASFCPAVFFVLDRLFPADAGG